MDANVNPRSATRPCSTCDGEGWVYPPGLPRESCTAPDCTLGRVPVVMPRVPVRAAVPGLTTEQRQAALEAVGEKWARAEERALAAEQERDQWRQRYEASRALTRRAYLDACEAMTWTADYAEDAEHAGRIGGAVAELVRQRDRARTERDDKSIAFDLAAARGNKAEAERDQVRADLAEIEKDARAEIEGLRAELTEKAHRAEELEYTIAELS